MKKLKPQSSVIIFIMFTLLATATYAQVDIDIRKNPSIIEVFNGNGHPWITKQVKTFYELYQGNMAWMYAPVDKSSLLDLFRNAADFGLCEKKYQFDFVNALRADTLQLTTRTDSLLADIRLTNAAIHFLHDIAFGSHAPPIGYNGLNYLPEYLDIALLLVTALKSGQLNNVISKIEPGSAEYVAIKNKIIQYNKLQADSLQESGIELTERLKELKEAINTIRWINGIRQSGHPVIVVNIPSASLLLWEQDKVLLESKVIVGKQSTRTPTLCSRVTDIVLYPHWTVPKKIASRELLPLIKKNFRYLDANNFQVLNEQGKIVAPSSIDWKKLNADYFPYTLRQSTGCDNSLGIIKLNFYSPYGVYLHDTPWKMLFAFSKRYFSHGCIRVEKAIELSRLLLKSNSVAIDTITEKGCLYNQNPIILSLPQKVAVFVLYNTAWVDSSATVRFSPDVYNKKSQR